VPPQRVWTGGAACFRGRQSILEGDAVLLIIAIILLIVAIAGGVIVHPLLFALAIVALVLFFTGR
jgi:cbb3-type cytochrome oxidase cytochrome c subunit